jgi:hypothetical protein
MAAMRVISVNVGLPRPVDWKGRTVMTGIFKEPVDGTIPIRRLNLDGNCQADLTPTIPWSGSPKTPARLSRRYRPSLPGPREADRGLLERAVQVEALPSSWREHFSRQLRS